MHNLDKLKETLEEIEVPYEKLAQGRKKAYQSVQMEKKRKQEWRYRLVLATICVGIMVTAIRYVVPTMMNTADQMPISETEPVSEQAVSEALFERLAITEKKNDLTFTLKGVAVEEKYMRVDYTVEAPYDISSLRVQEVEVFQNGKQVIGSTLYGWGNQENINYLKGDFELFVTEGAITSLEDFELHITFDDDQQTAFEIPFSLEKPLPATQHYTVNGEVTIQNQTFTVEEVTVSGLHTLIRFTTNPSNDMTLYSLGHIALLDEQGREWATSENSSMTFGGLSYGELELFLKNASLKRPEKMTLVLENVNALPKGEDYIIVDFNEKKVLQQPSAIQQTFEVGNGEIHYSILQDEQLSIRNAVDATGKEWSSNGHSTMGRHSTYYFESMPNPVKIYFYDYPNTIDFKKEILIYE